MAPDVADDDRSEALDVDQVGDEYPPERPLASEDYGVTGAEQRFDEPLEERLRREQPDRRTRRERDRQERVVQPIEPGDEDRSQADVVEDPDVADRGPDDEFTGDETTRDVATERVPPPAEEAALHVEDPNP